MAGHNKYSKIKHIKAKTDAQKSKMFTKLSRMITVEVKKAGGNPDSPGVKAAIAKAREYNMPNDTVDRAVKKASEANQADLTSVLYEAYGPGGSAIIIEALTDNRNRAAQEVKAVLAKNGSALAAQGSASWAFTKTVDGFIPQTTVPLEEADATALGALVDALEDLDDVQEVYTNIQEE